MKLILSTDNLMSTGQTVVRRPLFSKSNVELINGLRSNIALYQHHVSQDTSEKPNGLSYQNWTSRDGAILYIPSWRPTPLLEPRDSYEITVKLFYLPGIPVTRRCDQTREAIDLVCKELGVNSIDLLIVSYPGVSFDAEDEMDEENSGDESASAGSDESEGLDAQVKTWKTLESLYAQGTIHQLGLAEFSSDRLEKFIPEVKVKPAVDQINIKDCCVVPKDLIVYAREHQIELLTHNDCTDILPAGTTRELLGPGEKGANILAATPDASGVEQCLTGDVEPQWVVKYTAVVKDRGVVENKGYIAAAQVGPCVESRA